MHGALRLASPPIAAAVQYGYQAVRQTISSCCSCDEPFGLTPPLSGQAPTQKTPTSRIHQAGRLLLSFVVMITAHSLTKRYGAATAVDNLTFEVPPGCGHRLPGPNGSGKSTTMRMIMGLDFPTRGRP